MGQGSGPSLGDATVLALPWPLRMLSWIPGGVLASAGFFADSNIENGAEAVVRAGFVALGVIISIRLWRQSVTLHDDRAVVRGFFWSRTIARASALRVTSWGWLQWRNRRGQNRFTPISVFWTFGPAPVWYSEICGARLYRIARWIRRLESTEARHAL